MVVFTRIVPLGSRMGASKVRKIETFVYTCGCFGIAERKRGVKTVDSLHGCRDANAVLSRRNRCSMLLRHVG